jgi:5'(3')-deoxyribonucleotidase
MKNKKTVFLDLDGVLVDLFTGIEKKFGLTKGFLARKPYLCRPNSMDLANKLGMTEEDFWGTKANSIEFWENLPKYDWSDDLIMALFSNENIEDCYVLTAPSKICPACSSGKVAWLNKHYPFFVKSGKLIISTNKSLLAGENRILIDDTVKKVWGFHEAGGEVMLWPQIYNKDAFTMKDKKILRPKSVVQAIKMIKEL